MCWVLPPTLVTINLSFLNTPAYPYTVFVRTVTQSATQIFLWPARRPKNLARALTHYCTWVCIYLHAAKVPIRSDSTKVPHDTIKTKTGIYAN